MKRRPDTGTKLPGLQDDPLQPCWEKIPGVADDPDVIVREAFWYAAALCDAGWTITRFSGVGFAGTTPDGSNVSMDSPREQLSPLALQLNRLLPVLAFLGDSYVHQLAALMTSRAASGPIARPAAFSTVTEEEVMARLSTVTQLIEFHRAAHQVQTYQGELYSLLAQTSRGAALVSAINDMQNAMKDVGADPSRKALAYSLARTVAGWAASYELANDLASQHQGNP